MLANNWSPPPLCLLAFEATEPAEEAIKTSITRRSVEHCTPHADGAWLNELGWSQ